MLSVKREFGISPLRVTALRGSKPYKSALQLHVSFIDRIYPMLCEGHVEEAKTIGSAYNWKWTAPFK
jgi:hypothetical protein